MTGHGYVRSTAVLLLVMVAGAACATGTEPAATGSASTTSATSDAGDGATGDATYGSWRLTAGEADGQAIELDDTDEVTLLVQDGRASGVSGCNSYTANLDTTTGWRIDAPGVTRMACQERLMALETAYLTALEQVETATVDGSTLELHGPDVHLTFATTGPLGDD